MVAFATVAFGVQVYSLLSNAHPSTTANRTVPDVIIVSVDTERADHLETYGYHLPTSPHLTELARESILFRNATAPMPLTRPSLTSLHTGVDPVEHRVLENGHAPDLLKFQTIATVLADRGYQTAAFVGSGVLSGQHFGNLGFQLYDDRHNLHDPFAENLVFTERLSRFWGEGGVWLSADRVTDKVIEWLSSADDTPLFLWVHYFDPHRPYTFHSDEVMPSGRSGEEAMRALAEWRSRDIQSETELRPDDPLLADALDLYDQEIAFADENFGRLLQSLTENGRYDNSLIIFTADHGESFDHGYFFKHDSRLYEGLLRVPLVVRLPHGRMGGTATLQPLTLSDLAPMVYDVTGIAADANPGILEAIATGSSESGNRVTFHLTPRDPRLLRPKKLLAIRTATWKLIRDMETDGAELFDLSLDPEELNNLWSSHQAEAERLSRLLDQYEEELPRGQEQPEISDERLRILRSLGYVR